MGEKRNDQIEKLRKLCDPKTWPRDYIIIQGEIFEFVSNDPLEECIRMALYSGRFQ
jgi:hypothetical protein